MYNVTLKKVTAGHNIRTDTVIGHCDEYPIIGHPFTMYAESLSFVGGVRYITTSIVKDITVQDEYLTISTENSTYQLLFN